MYGVPQNTEKAKFEGITFNGSTFIDHFQLFGNVTFQSSINDVTEQRLFRRAREYGNVGLNYYIGQWNIGSEINAQGSKIESNGLIIPGYAVMNLVADYKMNNEIKLNLRLNNMLDKNYALAYDGNYAYQTPGASFFVNLRYEPQ